MKIRKKFRYGSIELQIVDRPECYMDGEATLTMTRVMAPNGGTIPITINRGESLKSITQKTLDFFESVKARGGNVEEELTKPINIPEPEPEKDTDQLKAELQEMKEMYEEAERDLKQSQLETEAKDKEITELESKISDQEYVIESLPVYSSMLDEWKQELFEANFHKFTVEQFETFIADPSNSKQRQKAPEPIKIVPTFTLKPMEANKFDPDRLLIFDEKGLLQATIYADGTVAFTKNILSALQIAEIHHIATNFYLHFLS